MGILNYLPEFKVFEPNRMTGLVTGHVLAQFPLNPASTLIKAVGNGGAVKVIENGYIVGLGNGLLIDKFAPANHGQPFVVFTEELNTLLAGNKYFATEAGADGVIYPRAVALYVGDVFTTNNYDLDGKTNPKFAKVVDGLLTLQVTADANTTFTAEKATTALGGDAYKFVFIGLGAAAFAGAAVAAVEPAMTDAAEAVLAEALGVGGDITEAIATHAALETGVHGLE